VLYVDDKLPRHPKIFKAGSMLGENGPALAVAVYLDGLAYAREHLTDGFLPDKFVSSSGLVQRPVAVAKALSSRGVQLWHRVRGGYQIHDYHHWNRKAVDIKKKREAEREKKRRQREAKQAANEALSLHVSPGDNSRTSCARASTYHVPLRSVRGPTQPRTDVLEERSTAAVASADSRPVENPGTQNAETTGSHTSGVAAAVRDREEPARAVDRTVGMVGADQAASGRIGFHGGTAGQADSGDGGGTTEPSGTDDAARVIAETKARVLALPPLERRRRDRPAACIRITSDNSGAN
jgi:hypothetical protein